MGCCSASTALAGKQASADELSPYWKSWMKSTAGRSTPACTWCRTLRANGNRIHWKPTKTREAAALKGRMDKVTKFIPIWVEVAVAIGTIPAAGRSGLQTDTLRNLFLASVPTLPVRVAWEPESWHSG